MGEEGLHRLRMVQAAADAAAVGRADDQGHVPLAIGAVIHLGGFVDDLVEGGMDKIGELDFADRAQIGHRRADTDCHDGKFS